MKWLIGVIVLNLLWSVNCVNNNHHEDVWEENLSNKFNIDASTEGLEKVQLKCGSDSMQVELLTKDDFTGVMYTRGSFYKQKEPCFVQSKATRGTRSLKMNFNFKQCQTLHEGDVFSNIVVVQHDPELVTTGDAAFQLECDFRKPRSLNVGAEFQARDSRPVIGSRITLTSPDPSAVATHKQRSKRDTVESDTHEVTFIPLDDNTVQSDDNELDESVKSDNDKEQPTRRHLIVRPSRNL